MPCSSIIGQLRQADTRAARDTLAWLESRKQDYAERARQELKAIEEAAGDSPEPDLDESEQRRRNSLRKKAGTNQATFAWLRGRLPAAERLRRRAAGEPIPGVHAAAEIEPKAVAGLGELGTPKSLPPLGEDEIVLVSGLPRSGTSMMMQMLASGGLPVLTDGTRSQDESNTRGYFELEAAKGRDGCWLEAARGKAVKLIAQRLAMIDPRSRSLTTWHWKIPPKQRGRSASFWAIARFWRAWSMPWTRACGGTRRA